MKSQRTPEKMMTMRVIGTKNHNMKMRSCLLLLNILKMMTMIRLKPIRVPLV